LLCNYEAYEVPPSQGACMSDAAGQVYLRIQVYSTCTGAVCLQYVSQPLLSRTCAIDI